MALSVELPNLLEYLQEHATRSAVLWPALLSCLLWLIARRQSLPRSHLIVWLMGIALSIVCSVWRHDGDSLSLHMLPGYPLLLVLLSREQRPSPLQTYSLTFLSLLIADVWCAARYFIANPHLAEGDFYQGVGGAGLRDSLFILPFAMLLLMRAFALAESHPSSRRPLSHLFAPSLRGMLSQVFRRKRAPNEG